MVTIIKAIVNNNEIKSSKVLVEAKIMRVSPGGRTDGRFDCLFRYKNKEKELPCSSTIANGRHDFIGKTFPAMYSPKKDNLEILMTPEDFKKFDMPYPDSLYWVVP